MIDDFGVWRRALSPQEALAIYNAGQAGQDLSLVSQPGSAGLLSITKVGANANFSWVGYPELRLQKATTLNPANFTDVPGTTGASAYSEPISGSAAYFRLHAP